MVGRKPNPRRGIEGDTRKIGANKLKAKLASEPSTTKGLPPCPEHLTGKAREAWGFWSAELADMNLDRRPDAMMLEGACVAYQQATQADSILADEGPVCLHVTVDRETGHELRKLKAHPAVAISRSAWTQLRSFASEFGLSPVSRTRLSIEKKSDGQDLASLLSAPRTPRPAVQ